MNVSSFWTNYPMFWMPARIILLHVWKQEGVIDPEGKSWRMSRKP